LRGKTNTCVTVNPLGPWKDEPLSELEDPEVLKQKKLREEGVLTILKKKDLMGKIDELKVRSYRDDLRLCSAQSKNRWKKHHFMKR